MKTLLVLVEDDLTLDPSSWLPKEGAWVLDKRYDEFRCSIHAALSAYQLNDSEYSSYPELVRALDAWLNAETQ